MKRITVENYRSDKYYGPVVRAADVLLARRGFVSPTELFVEMGLLSSEAIVQMAHGQAAFFGTSDSVQSERGQPNPAAS